MFNDDEMGPRALELWHKRAADYVCGRCGAPYGLKCEECLAFERSRFEAETAALVEMEEKRMETAAFLSAVADAVRVMEADALHLDTEVSINEAVRLDGCKTL